LRGTVTGGIGGPAADPVSDLSTANAASAPQANERPPSGCVAVGSQLSTRFKRAGTSICSENLPS